MASTGYPSVKPKKSLGQNFLIDENIVRNIIRDLKPHAEDVIVEIGPGKGALTKLLANRSHHLILVEIDGRIIEDLRRTFPSTDTITVLHQDFLDTDLDGLHRQFGRKLRVVGNIPYHLTSPILFKVFDAHGAVGDLTIMIQREVARRIIATPGTKDYGILSVMTRFYGEPELLFNVSPNCFVPRPNVTSTVLRIRFHERIPYDVDVETFKTVVRTTFGKRRKILRNSLQYLPYEEHIAEKISEATPFSEKRPEELTVGQFAELTREIQSVL